MGANVTWLKSLLVHRVSHFLSKGHSVSSVDLIFLIHRVEQKMLLSHHLGQDLWCPYNKKKFLCLEGRQCKNAE